MSVLTWSAGFLALVGGLSVWVWDFGMFSTLTWMTSSLCWMGAFLAREMRDLG